MILNAPGVVSGDKRDTNIAFRSLTEHNGNSDGRTFAEELVLPAVPDGGQGETSVSGRGAEEEVLGS